MTTVKFNFKAITLTLPDNPESAAIVLYPPEKDGELLIVNGRGLMPDAIVLRPGSKPRGFEVHRSRFPRVCRFFGWHEWHWREQSAVSNAKEE